MYYERLKSVAGCTRCGQIVAQTTSDSSQASKKNNEQVIDKPPRNAGCAKSFEPRRQRPYSIQI
jgi:hypothetical protein